MQYSDFEREEMLPFVPVKGRILDVGCNKGGFGAHLKARGAEVWGVEPDMDCAAIAATRLDRVIHGRYPEDIPAGTTFDCVVFNDVLEHMVDPIEVLLATHRLLASSGVIVASIPNVRNLRVVGRLLLRGRWDYADVGILDRTHLRFFTRGTMRELFENTGYRVEQLSPINLERVTRRWTFFGRLPKAADGKSNSANRRWAPVGLLPKLTREEFLAQQYVVVAYPVRA